MQFKVLDLPIPSLIAYQRLITSPLGTVSAAEPVATVAGYMAHKMVDKASTVLPARILHPTDTTVPVVAGLFANDHRFLCCKYLRVI
jgi:hypothetical protein